LNDELHARPHLRMPIPSRVTHLALLSGEYQADRAHIEALCTRFGLSTPAPNDRQVILQIDGRILKWERHTEFTSVTVVQPNPPVDGSWSALSLGLADWVEGLPGERLVAVHLRLEEDTPPQHDAASLAAHFCADVQGSAVHGGDALVWTDFQIQRDGHTRVLIRAVNLTPGRAGRLAQRLLEVETYRMMALLSLPLAREVAGTISHLERELGAIVERTASHDETGVEDERRLLDALTLLAAESEALTARTRYRFGATTAYAELVERRLTEMREERIPGLQRLGIFLERRFGPAVRTCQAVARRQAELAEGISRASGLLRTRVDVHLSAQNADLLRTMAARTEAQLKIQEAVEGLSVFAIAYYALGLLKYVLEGLPAVGMGGEKQILTAIAAPVVLAAIWLGVRRLKRVMRK
jgi:uncharacterized membrane-anchored protein